MEIEESSIKELEKYGIHFIKDNQFNCDNHPYKEETMPASVRQELFYKLGNMFFYDATTNKLTIKNELYKES